MGQIESIHDRLEPKRVKNILIHLRLFYSQIILNRVQVNHQFWLLIGIPNLQ
jgi:hypothetical protein